MSVNKLLHIPGWGEFQMSQMFAAVDPFPLNLNRKQRKQPEVPEEDEPKLLDVPDPKCQVSLDTTYEVDLKDEEQTWPTNEEIQDAFEEHQLKRKSKLPRGTSDYQATWILSSDEEDDSGDEDERSEEEMEGDDFSLDMAPPPTDGGSE
ncbi:UNVERIFIED_CONTAM: hypothetical protein GTU68_007724, partial [Idotea baltica]|nr:hypothetical protein [Idotea baltica]